MQKFSGYFMFISISDIFKVGIGPSSSHTMGPMVAANMFLDHLRGLGSIPENGVLKARLHGSLAFTGKGHATDNAVILGLAGQTLDTLDAERVGDIVQHVYDKKYVENHGLPRLKFNPEIDLVFDYGPSLPAHPNGMVLSLETEDGRFITDRIYYSIGGGFVKEAAEMEATQELGYADSLDDSLPKIPYPFSTAAEMLKFGLSSGLSIAEMKRQNELVFISETELNKRLDRIWEVMNNCIERGLSRSGALPGGLNVKRRAADIMGQLKNEMRNDQPGSFQANEWLSLYAMAVNEENAAGGQVVTAPTNGAAGVTPAVLRYYVEHEMAARPNAHREYLLTAAAIGGIIKHNASISGAEVGCQGEVGSASAMAAAGICALKGGSNEQIENAAEIALEHHMGMTCDPVAGLVQVPCIERNGLGAVKAVTAAALALRGDGSHYMPLDNCIEAMRQTGLDMNEKYKETSQGGLAVNLPQC